MTTPLLVIVGLAVAVSAAARSTWSPCGLSMLSSITPLAENGRGHRYRTTVLWFILGAVIGGIVLGGAAALVALGVGALAPSATTVVAIAAGASVVALVSDLGVRGVSLPVHHRQVNERWLDQFRAWVYGVGFGLQIGMGLATYIMTAALYLLLVIAALSGSVAVALCLGAVFGLVRGLAVLLGRTITNPDTLRSFHRRFSALGPKVRLIVISVEGGSAGAFIAAVWLPAAAALALGAVLALVLWVTTAGGLVSVHADSDAAASAVSPTPRTLAS